MRIVKRLTLKRTSIYEDWGLRLTGGWHAGQWIEITSVFAGSPAERFGLRKGDFLVQVQDQLVFFSTADEVESMLERSTDLDLPIQIERGKIEPMTPHGFFPETPPKIQKNPGDTVTIVLDKDRGIYESKFHRK